MRKILMVGTPLVTQIVAGGATSLMEEGVEKYVPEDTAYWLVKTGEATYVYPADTVSEARYGELVAIRLMRGAQQWAQIFTGGRVPCLFTADHPTEPVFDAAEAKALAERYTPPGSKVI